MRRAKNVFILEEVGEENIMNTLVKERQIIYYSALSIIRCGKSCIMTNEMDLDTAFMEAIRKCGLKSIYGSVIALNKTKPGVMLPHELIYEFCNQRHKPIYATWQYSVPGKPGLQVCFVAPGDEEQFSKNNALGEQLVNEYIKDGGPDFAYWNQWKYFGKYFFKSLESR